MCASCGAFLEAHRCKTTLWYGLITRFCTEDCQARFAQEWRKAVEKANDGGG